MKHIIPKRGDVAPDGYTEKRIRVFVKEKVDPRTATRPATKSTPKRGQPTERPRTPSRKVPNK